MAKFKASPISPNRNCAGYYSISCGSLQPKFSWSHRTSLSYREFDLSLLWRHLDGMEQEPLAIATSGRACCGFDRIPAFDYFDLSLRVEPHDNFTLVLSVQNLLDKEPPLVGSSVGVQNPSFNSGNTFPSTYDTLGRRFAVGATMRF